MRALARLSTTFCIVGALLLGAACAPGAQVSLHINTSACAAPGPLDGVTHMRVAVSGPGFAALTTAVAVSQHTLNVPDIPPGADRVVEVRGYRGDPGNKTQPGEVLSVGRSGPFTVKVGAKAQTLEVQLRRVNTFTPTGPAGACTTLAVARAAATATALPDGRVLIAGGFGAPDGTRALLSTELFNPATGSFSPGPDLSSARAYHTATALPNGQVLIAGGESSQAVGASVILGDALVFDAVQGVVSTVPLQTARSRHGAAGVSAGNVLLVGGIASNNGLAGTPEAYDPANNTTSSASGSVTRTELAVMVSPDGQGVIAAGGTDGTQVHGEVFLFPFSGGAFQAPLTSQLNVPRRGAAASPFQDSTHAVIAGGYQDASLVATTPAGLGTSELITQATGPVIVNGGPVLVPRGQVCTVALAQGGLLVTGGATASAGAYVSAAETELMTASGAGTPITLGMPPLTTPRYLHACAPLADGSALVVGGLDSRVPPGKVLADAYIFTAAPKN